MSGPRVTFRIRGEDALNGELRFEYFIKQLASIRHALSETARIVSGPRSVYFRVAELSKNSPASVVLEAVPRRADHDRSREIISTFTKSIALIQQGVAPERFDYEAFQAFREMTSLVGKEISEMVIAEDGQSIPVREPLAGRIEDLLGSDEYEMGSVAGLLDVIDVHAGHNLFVVYPTARQPKVRCIFPPEMKLNAIQALTQYVEVFGELKYKSKQLHPYEMLVRSIEVLPPQEQLPKLSDLKGTAPDATDDLASEEFVRRMRDEWES